MTLDRPTKTFLAVFTLVAALLIAVSNAIQETPLEKWWLPALLFLISLALWVWMWQEKIDDDTKALTIVNGKEPASAQEWIISKENQSAYNSSNSVTSAEEALRKEMDKTVATITQTSEVTEAAPSTPSAADVPPTAPVTVTVVEEAAPPEPIVADVPASDPIAVAEAEEAAPVTPAAPDVKAEVPATSSSEVDDLERVEGIGPKYADALVAAGIRTFEDVANASVEQFEKAAKDAGMRRTASMATWAEQAALAAKGDWDGLNALQEKLSGGRRG